MCVVQRVTPELVGGMVLVVVLLAIIIPFHNNGGVHGFTVFE